METFAANWSSVLFWSTVVALIVLLLLASNRRRNERDSGLYVIFFFSGFPAIIYQLVWQRALFDIYGVNIESVTIVVTAFMLGLGLGSLAGGQISRIRLFPRLTVFSTVELGIAGYGLLSLRLFHRVALLTAGASLAMTALISFLLVFIPTLLMGSTLPLLVAHMVQFSKNVGYSVGKLYFANTLGSAVACFIAANLTMKSLGQSGSIALAAAINVCVGSSVMWLYLRSRRNAPAIEENKPSELGARGSEYLPLLLGMAIAGIAGFIALGYELLWYRVISYVTEGLARSFAVLLGSYLGGIAFGSFGAENVCRKCSHFSPRRWITLIALFVIIANLTAFLIVPFLANSIRWISYESVLPMVGLAAALLGAVFPLLAHATIPPDSKSGARLSYLYLSNIVGSASGSFVVGFVWMDRWSLPQISILLALIGIIAGSALLASGMPKAKLIPALACCSAVAVGMTLVAPSSFNHIYEKLYYKQAWDPQSRLAAQQFEKVIETRSGVVTVSANGSVFGDGSLEAHLGADLENASYPNFLIPPFSLSALHPNPKHVLMIGLGCGAWAQVIANHPQVEKLTVVEINPGYLKLISQTPDVAGILTNPKVRIVIDDGRRWLLENPDTTFDAIVINTRLHWREYASSLLSVEFDNLAEHHLAAGGIFMYNATFSPRALVTGATIFPYSIRLGGYLIVSKSPIVVDKERWKETLLQYTLDGRRVLDPAVPQQGKRLEKILAVADVQPLTTSLDVMENGSGMLQRYRGLPLITDDNMGDEWF